ncbi:MAG: efflux transporter outer membrane subunit [Haliea sp.]|jgi:outer membrane protein, multidrug efflux system
MARGTDHGILLPILLSALLSGCALGPELRTPEVPLPDQWRLSQDEATGVVDAQWWSQFNDPVLDSLIATAIANNLDLAEAAARIEAFAARTGIVGAGRWPQLGYDASAGRSDVSRQTGAGAAAPSGSSDLYQANLGIRWEIDLWGRIGAATAAAEAEFFAAEDNRNALLLSVVAAVAETYIQLRALDDQLQVAQALLDARRSSLELFELQLERGVLSELEVAQLRSELERNAATIPALVRRIALTENALSVLLGQAPAALSRGSALAALDPPLLPAGLPSDLLSRRPDVRAAAQQLTAAGQRVGVARAARFPRLSLTGLLGVASSELSDLTRSGAEQSQVAGGLAGPLFTAGRVSSEIDAAVAEARQAEASYRRTVLNALREAEDALLVYTTTQDESAALQRRVAAVRAYLSYAEMRYEGGYASYLAVLDAQRSLFDAELQALQARAEVLRASVAVYKAFGGSWGLAAPP